LVFSIHPGRTVFFLCRCQQRIKQPGSLLFADILRMAVGSFQKGGICVPQQVGRHLLAGTVFQQIGGEEMPHGVQVVFLGKTVPVIQPPQMVTESIGVYWLAFSLENQPVPVGPVVFQGLLSEQLSQISTTICGMTTMRVRWFLVSLSSTPCPTTVLRECWIFT